LQRPHTADTKTGIMMVPKRSPKDFLLLTCS